MMGQLGRVVGDNWGYRWLFLSRDSLDDKVSLEPGDVVLIVSDEHNISYPTEIHVISSKGCGFIWHEWVERL